jgi:hypothetical protein|tara:strand:+ start:2785 stop:3018 length:234 start_codon:yes stop_codon:yes gene_type:complete
MIDLNLCNPQHVKALHNIKETGNSSLSDFFQAEIDEAKAKLVIATDTVSIHRLQGRAEAFQDLLTAIDESFKVVNRS